MTLAYPQLTGGASLLLSFRLHSRQVLIIGSGTLAASRAFAALEADSSVVILAKGGAASSCDELRWRSEKGQVSIVDWDSLPGSSSSSDDRDIEFLRYFLNSSSPFALACVTDTVIGSTPRALHSARKLYELFRNKNIPVNITDVPSLCDFSFTATHRFSDSQSGKPSALQVGVTTNGQGCRLGGRIKREIVAALPKEAAAAVEKVGKMRTMTSAEISGEDSFDDSGVATPNRPVPVRTPSQIESDEEGRRRKMKWVAQVSEYWPLKKLALLEENDMQEVLTGDIAVPVIESPSTASSSVHGLDVRPPPGRIYLVGSGPGHPSLLTIATHTALTKLADVVLSDKLVPAAVLALIPPTVEVKIARKFPGNADGAQEELMHAAVEAAMQGKTVVRLKQGDPSIYGRMGEEILFFRSKNLEPVLIPGVSSALAAPTFAGIPITQRGVAESFIVCTGVGRKGKEVELPGYERPRTVILLMGVARLAQIVSALLEDGKGRRAGERYPSCTPIAVIERASMSDQRIITSTLGNVVQALDSHGEQRPPGLIVVGWAVLSLWREGDVEVLDSEQDDAQRIMKWLDGERWRSWEGVSEDWDVFK